MAGDMNVDQCIGPYDTYEEASEAIDKMMKDHYDPSFDTAFVVSPQTYAEALKEIKDAEDEDAAAEAERQREAKNL